MSNKWIIRLFQIKLLLTNWTTINSQDLSDWEKQFITTFWMATFMDDQENLFLYDEPDTFLHPNWQKEFIPSLIDPQSLWWLIVNNNWDTLADNNWNKIIFPHKIKSHFIITTHSPLLVWSSENIDIIWLENKDWKSEIICHTKPELFEENENIEKIDIYGNRAEFIYERLFLDEWKTTRADKFEEEISKLHNLLKKKSEWNDLDEKEMNEFLGLKEFLKSKIWDDLDDLYLSYLSINELSALIKEKNEKDR